MSIEGSRYRNGKPRVQTMQQKAFHDTVQNTEASADSAELDALAKETKSPILAKAARILSP